MEAKHYIIALSLTANTSFVQASQSKILEAETKQQAEDECAPLLSDKHKLLITQCESINLSASTEGGDLILIESKGHGNSITIHVGSPEEPIDSRKTNNDDPIDQEMSEAELIKRLLKRRDLSPEAIQRHIDRIKKRKSSNKVEQHGCIEGQNCIDINTEYPIDELELESSK